MAKRTKPKKKRTTKGNVPASSRVSERKTRPHDPSMQMPRPTVTEFTRIVAVPMFPGRTDLHPAGSPGDYEIRFILGVPGVTSVASEINVRALLHSGDSLVAGVEGDIEIFHPDGTAAGRATLHSNAYGHLAEVRAKVTAESFDDAEQVAHDYVMPTLSRIAFEVNVPLEVKVVVAVELSTGTQAMSGTLVGAVQQLHSLEGWSTPELRMLLGVYREGLNSTAPLYQALSFYKVIEGVATHHTKKSRAAARTGATAPPDVLQLRLAEQFEVLGENPWASDDFAAYLGMTFGDIRDAFTDTIRNAIAHLTPGREVRNPDKASDIFACRRAVPVLRHVARELLKRELEQDVVDPNTGTVTDAPLKSSPS